MELAIQKYIRQHGLEATLSQFALVHKDYPHKVLVKYNTIESNFTNEEVRDARGLVLYKDGWDVASLAFRKFFNLGEGHAAPIDWNTARVFKKMDGTLIHVYHDRVTGEICFGTTGTAEGEGDVDNFHYTNGEASTFADLFWTALLETNVWYWKENPRKMYEIIEGGLFENGRPSSFKNATELHNAPALVYENRRQAFSWWAGYTIAFELCTPYNIVVTPHTENRVYLLGMRNLKTGEEVPYDKLARIADSIGVPLAPSYPMSNADEILKTFEQMSFKDEGYVVCDANFNRIKIKNPAYVAVHFMKEKTAFWRVVDIVRGAEVEEFAATFPNRADEMRELETKWKDLISKMDRVATSLMPVIEPFWEEFYKLPPVLDWTDGQRIEFNKLLAPYRKPAAMTIQQAAKDEGLLPFMAYFFKLMTDKNARVKDYLMEYDGKELYEWFSKKK